MKTESLNHDHNGKVMGFMIKNSYISINKSAFILSTVQGVSHIEKRRLFSKSSKDVHIRFMYEGVKCLVLEPYGDNSDYWVVPDDENDIDKINIKNIQMVFENYIPPYWRRIIGGLISFDLRAVFGGKV